jgi:hypothetical protein
MNKLVYITLIKPVGLQSNASHAVLGCASSPSLTGEGERDPDS